MAQFNPGNWHWVDKSILSWSRTWFDDELPKISAEDRDVSVKITKVITMSDDDTDVLIIQKKTEVFLLFGITLVLEISATVAEEDDISGEINVNEFSGKTTEDQFEFGVTVNSKSEESKKQVRDLIRTKIDPQLRAQLAQFVPAALEKHTKDVKNDTTDKVSEKPAVPKPIEEKPAAAPAQPIPAAIVNTTTLTDQEEFRTTAEELFKTFTDEARLAAFTRARPKAFEGAKKGGKFELFDGNVAGEFLELEEPTKIVQSWRLKQWPAGHYSKQEIEFNQNDEDGVTVMRVTWTGVPLGQEDVTKGNWGEYYVRSIKRTFGFGTIL